MQPEHGWNQVPPANRMETHLKVVAVVNIVFGVLFLLGALFMLLAFGIASAITGSVGAPGWIPGFLAGLGVVFVVIVAAFGLLYLFAGLQLNQRKRTGKALGFVTSVVSVFSFPIGTAFAAYAFWVLLQKETDALLAT
jgi:hypothetical protein